MAVKANGLILPRPKTLSVPEAAAFFFGGLTAADFLLDQCALQLGERVLVVGATGAVGSAAVQIAHYHGAQVTALALHSRLRRRRTHGKQPRLPQRAPDTVTLCADFARVRRWPSCGTLSANWRAALAYPSSSMVQP